MHGKRFAYKAEKREVAMTARGIYSALILMLIGWTPDVLYSQPASPPSNSAFSAVEVSREHHYQVDARARPFLFWIRKSNIGDGRLTWRKGPDGTVGYELLVGSDPTRTPRHINRWGYLREESGSTGAVVFGVMSQSDEQSVQDADKNTSRSEGTHVFKALQQSVTGSEMRVTISDVRVSKDLTYADLDSLLAAVPAAPSTTRTKTTADWSSPGFLAAAASLIEEARVTAGKVSQSARFTRVYPHNGNAYQLQLRSADRMDRYTRDGQSFESAIRGQFHVLNRTTMEETPFTVIFGVKGDLAGVPLLISWRPRWWLEIECVLHDDGRK
jgi:hypothetical protein